jgi:CubicO group peptidase (beta-lactamase class C family)
MTRLTKYLVALALLSSPLTAWAQTSADPQKIDAYLARLAGFGLTGAVLVARDGRVLLEKGYGLADRKRNLPFTKETVFDIGSNTKDFTKLAVLQLAERGKLGLNDTLAKFFDGVPADKAAITVEQLMEHTAGFGMYSGRDDERVTKEEFLRRVFSAPLISAPGKEENYSNPGYSLLAAIIEKVSGQFYEQYVRDHILAPSGMTTTGYALPKWRDGQLARNYEDGEERPSTFDYPHLPDGQTWNLRGNGGMLSTVGDMYKFHLALEGDRLLSPKFKAKLFDFDAPIELVGGNGVHFFVYRREPADRLVVLIATTDAAVRATEVSGRIAALARGRDVPLPPQTVKLDAAALVKLAGDYKLPSGAELSVSVKGEGLFVAGANEAGFRLLEGGARGDAGRAEKLSARVKAMLDAAAKGDYGLTHQAFGAAMPYEQFKPRQEAMWRQRGERLGAFKSVTVLSTSSSRGGYVTTARLDFERGADYVQFMWDGGGTLRGVRAMATAPGRMFYPQSATEFVSFNLSTGESVGIGFKPNAGDSGFSVTVQPSPNSASSAPASTAKTGPAKLPDTAAGRIVAAYVEAFNSGDDAAMREFFQKHLSKSSLVGRTMEERLKANRRLRDELGELSVSAVAESGGQGLSVTMQTRNGAAAEFGFELDAAEPQKLKALRIEVR